MIRIGFKTLWQEGGVRGKSTGRILTNEALRQWRKYLQGLVLDLACGPNPSYWRVFLGVDKQ
jgi:hypothetical protein